MRHAISSLQWLSVEHTATFDPRAAFDSKGTKKKKASGSSSSGRRKKKGSEDAAAAAAADGAPPRGGGGGGSARDETFSVFHSVGKILYAKATEMREVEAIVEASDVGPLSFMEWINTNYIEHLFAPQLPMPAAAAAAAAAVPKKPATIAAAPPARGAAAAASASAKPPSSSPPSSSFFDADFGPDLDTDTFDRLMQSSSSSSSASAAAAASSSKATFDHAETAAQVQAQQAAMDEEALQALVECTQNFSDADILAAGAKGHFGDVRLHTTTQRKTLERDALQDSHTLSVISRVACLFRAARPMTQSKSWLRLRLHAGELAYSIFKLARCLFDSTLVILSHAFFCFLCLCWMRQRLHDGQTIALLGQQCATRTQESQIPAHRKTRMRSCQVCDSHSPRCYV